MAALWILAGVIWVIWQLVKESNIKPVPMDTDLVKVNSDRCSGKYTNKEIDRRIQSGYYKKGE